MRVLMKRSPGRSAAVWAAACSLAAGTLVAAGVMGASAATGQAAAPAAASSVCQVTYTVNSDWGTGFSIAINITNNGPAITSWTLGYAYAGNQKIAQGWSGNWSQSGENITVTNASWNGSLATGGSTQIGANFSYTGTNTAPTVFTLNGSTCNGSGGGGTPTVSITSPANGATFTAPASIPITASASESGGSISKVEFFNGATLLGTATSSPYTFTWSGVPAGTYSLTAEAFDASGTTATSSAVSVTVNPATTPSVVASPTSLSVTQGGTGTFGVSLSTAPTSNVTVTVSRTSGNTGLSVSSGGSLTFTPANFGTALTFTPSNWNYPQPVTVTADTSSAGNATFTVSASGYPAVSVTGSEIPPGSTGTPAHAVNPFTGSTWYVNPDYTAEVATSAAGATGTLKSQMTLVGQQSTGIWLDRIAAIYGGSGNSNRMSLEAHLRAALSQESGSTPILVPIVVYDLPNRDCAALASNGELTVSNNGLTYYAQDYINPIAQILTDFSHTNIRVIAIGLM